MRSAVIICRTEDKKKKLVLEEGEFVNVISRNKRQAKVKTEDGITAWLSIRNLSEKLAFRG